MIKSVAAALGLAGVAAAASAGDIKTYMEQKSSESGVYSLPGKGAGKELLFKVLKHGDESKGRPTAGTPCQCHYRGRLPLKDMEAFDSSYSRGEPTQFAPNQVIPGWTEIMQDMYVGERRQMYLHPELGYGAQAIPGVIPENSVLQFEMEIMSCNGQMNMSPREKTYELAHDNESANNELRKDFPKVADQVKDDAGATHNDDL